MHSLVLFSLVLCIGLSSQSSQVISKFDLTFPLKAVAIIKGESKDPVTNEVRKISGVIEFEQYDATSNVIVRINIIGLPLNGLSYRGFHIHSYGISDPSDNVTIACGSTGPHFNPTNTTHGYLTSLIRHSGDLGNVRVNPDGSVTVEVESDIISLYDHKYSIIGRSIVLHELTDDGGLLDTAASRNTGSAGARIACGTIGLVKTAEEKTSKRVMLQITSPSVEDMERKLMNSWAYEFFKSNIDTLKIDEEATRVEDAMNNSPLFSAQNFNTLDKIMGDLSRAKEDIEKMMKNTGKDLNSYMPLIKKKRDYLRPSKWTVK